LIRFWTKCLIIGVIISNLSTNWLMFGSDQTTDVAFKNVI